MFDNSSIDSLEKFASLILDLTCFCFESFLSLAVNAALVLNWYGMLFQINIGVICLIYFGIELFLFQVVFNWLNLISIKLECPSLCLVVTVSAFQTKNRELDYGQVNSSPILQKSTCSKDDFIGFFLVRRFLKESFHSTEWSSFGLLCFEQPSSLFWKKMFFI